MTIAILCPTYRRPEQVKRMIKSAYTTSQDTPNIYLGYVDGEDYGDPQTHIITFPDMPTAYKWNLMAEQAMTFPENKLFMLGADDMVFATPCWDKALLDHYDSLENKIHVYALLDSRDPDGTPHPIVTKEWIETMGWFLPPIFLHFYVDTWTVEIAKYNGCFTHMKDYQLLHEKNEDETHNKIRNLGWVNRDKYVDEHCQHYLEIEKMRLKARMV